MISVILRNLFINHKWLCAFQEQNHNYSTKENSLIFCFSEPIVSFYHKQQMHVSMRTVGLGFYARSSGNFDLVIQSIIMS